MDNTLSSSSEFHNRLLRALECGNVTDEVIEQILNERLEQEKNKFKVSAVAIILRRLERAKRLLEAVEDVEEEIFSHERLSGMRDHNLLLLYQQLNQNISQLIDLLMTFDNKIQVFNDNRSVNLTVENKSLDINTAQALRNLIDIIKRDKRETSEKSSP